MVKALGLRGKGPRLELFLCVCGASSGGGGLMKYMITPLSPDHISILTTEMRRLQLNYRIY